MLKIIRTNIAQTAIFRCAGDLIHGCGPEELMTAVVAQPARRILLDLEEVGNMDAAGLGTLVSLLNWSQGQKFELTVVNPSQRVRQLLEITSLDQVFHINAWQDLMQECPSHAA